MRIACYGLVDRTGGSVTAANFIMLDELLQRGHQIDFYTFEGFVYPEGLFEYPGFRYFTVATQDEQRFVAGMPSSVGRLLGHALGHYYYTYVNLPKLERRVAEEHARAPYDVLLFMGMQAEFAGPPGLPVVSWVQGPPQTEWQAIQRLRDRIVALCGRTLYLKLKALYAFKLRRAAVELRRADLIVCGSNWSREHILAFGVPGADVKALPYPMDLALFQPSPEPRPDRPFTLLWLGRTDPRKRLDLILDAFALLLEEIPDARLVVAGSFGYAAGYQRLLDTFPHPERLTYIENIERPGVPPLIHAADVVVQPSESENFGSAVAEALCCGKPVVLGPTNGTKDYVGEAGFLFDAYTPASLKDALLRAHTALRERDDLGRVARATAETNFDPETVVGQLENAIHATRAHYAPPAVSSAG